MYKLCKTEQSTRRQREFEHSLLRLMKTTRYDDITVSEICDTMNVPRKAFYRYFDSKDGALHALIDHTLIEYESFGSAYREKGERRSLVRDLEQFFIFWIEKQELLDALSHSNLTGLLIQTSVRYSVSDMINPKKFLPNESDWMRSQVFSFAICGLMTSMLEWYNKGFKESTRDMAKAACRMLSLPLFPNLAELGLTEQ